MPRLKIVQAMVDAVSTPKTEVKSVKTPRLAIKCDNCNDSGMTCSVCFAGQTV